MREIKFRAWIEFSKRMLCHYEINWRTDTFYNEDIQLMQYTGSKDKNGVEVYEGDIIKAKDFLTKDNKTYYDDIGVVEFKDGMFLICDEYPSVMKGQIIEVIGNIYENKELLDG